MQNTVWITALDVIDCASDHPKGKIAVTCYEDNFGKWKRQKERDMVLFTREKKNKPTTKQTRLLLNGGV